MKCVTGARGPHRINAMSDKKPCLGYRAECYVILFKGHGHTNPVKTIPSNQE